MPRGPVYGGGVVDEDVNGPYSATTPSTTPCVAASGRSCPACRTSSNRPSTRAPSGRSTRAPWSPTSSASRRLGVDLPAAPLRPARRTRRGRAGLRGAALQRPARYPADCDRGCGPEAQLISVAARFVAPNASACPILSMESTLTCADGPDDHGGISAITHGPRL